MNPMAGVLRMHYRDKWMWIIMPWLILLFSFFVNVVIGFFIKEPMYTGGLVSIFIYMLVTGIITLTQTFHFALGLSVRRIDYFLGTSLMATLISAVFAFLLFILSITENKVTGGWGIHLHYFHLPYLNDGTSIEQIWIYFIGMLHMFFLGFVIFSIFRRFSWSGLFVFFAIMFILYSVCGFLLTYNQWWGDVFEWLSKHTAFELSLWLLPLTVLYAILSFLMLRKSTV